MQLRPFSNKTLRNTAKAKCRPANLFAEIMKVGVVFSRRTAACRSWHNRTLLSIDLLWKWIRNRWRNLIRVFPRPMARERLKGRRVGVCCAKLIRNASDTSHTTTRLTNTQKWPGWELRNTPILCLVRFTTLRYCLMDDYAAWLIWY